ncbi:MAG: DUF58 domain-containing protein [Haloarculaceae archaeon]
MATVRQTRRWRGVVAVALFAGAAGLLFKRPTVLLLSVVGITYAAYPRLLSAPTPSLDLERALDPEDPAADEDVTVEVTVHNDGDAVLPDVRIVDGVPPMLSVSDGTPRHAATLRPGESTSFSYAVTAKQGTHQFEPATAIARDVSGGTEVETEVDEGTAIECVTDVPEVPLRRQTRAYPGRIAGQGGSGVEFYRTREYQRGDAMNRVDWKRFARTGELATTEFREERAASVVLCLDARATGYRAADEDEPHGVAYGLAAAEQLLTALAETPNTVGIAGVGERLVWLPPGKGTGHVTRLRRQLVTDSTFSPYPPAEPATDDAWDDQLSDLRDNLGIDTQVVYLSPLLDEFALSAAMTVEAAGNAITVVSPDVTAGETAGGKLAVVERRNRLHALRESGVRIVDWDPDEPLGTALAHAQERWSR